MIRLACPSCKRNLRVKEELAGKRGVCPHCRQRLIVPAATPTNLLDAATVTGAPMADLNDEALDFLAPPQTRGELGRLGTYRILRVLGAGGMGVVLHAEDLVLKRAVALKVMRSALAKSKDARQRFLREARAIAAIEHRHIVTVYQVAEDRGVPFLAMPFLKGESLETRLQRERKLLVAEAIRLGRQIAEGLAAAHKNDLIHRDIKPGNIWLETQDDPREPRDWVKLLDFGLARAAGEDDQTLTKLGTILGTPGYMAPEQARGVKVDARCDLFSLGAVLYRMLTGSLPFKGKDTMSQLMSLAEDTPRPLRELNADVPPPLADVVTQLLGKNPDERPSSARAVADALAALEDVSAPLLASTASKRQFTPNERAILEAPTRLIDPAAPARTAKEPVITNSIGMKLVRVEPGVFLIPAAPARTAKEPVITNSIGMKLVRVEPGVFLIGSPENELAHSGDEHQHEVEITRPFYVGVYEVTQEQYQRVMGENPSKFASTGSYKDKVQGMDTRQFPVESVSWKEAVKFCHLLSELPEEKANGRLYRLPTEAEWEYVCRGGPFFKKPSPPFSFGDSLSSTQANFDGNFPYGGAAKGVYLERTTKVGSYPPILLESTTYTAMSGNGVPTDTTRITTIEVLGKTRKAQRTASAVFCAGVPGAAAAGTAAPPAATALRPAFATSSTAFALFSLPVRGLSNCLSLLPLYPFTTRREAAR